MKILRKPLYSLIALVMSSWSWLTPLARLYKAAALAVLVLLVLVMVDRAFVLPKLEGWLGVGSLLGALGIMGWMLSRWNDLDDAVDVPRDWIAPVETRER